MYLGSWTGILGLNCYPCYFQLLTLSQTGALREFPTNTVHTKKTLLTTETTIHRYAIPYLVNHMFDPVSNCQ